MTPKRRLGILGFGHLGKYLYEKLPRDEYEVVFVWNRNLEVLDGQVPKELVLDTLEDAGGRGADLIIEVAHPEVTKRHGRKFVAEADYLIGSPTALSDPDLRKDLERGRHGVYVPAGALWGAQDINKMERGGAIQDSEEEPAAAAKEIGWKRQRMTSETVHMLEAEFAQQPKPDKSQIEEIASRLGQKEMNIYAWFYRRRRSKEQSGDSAEEETPKAKKKRNRMNCRYFTREEQLVLENVFARQSHPGESEIAGLARWFRKDEKKISAWFARRRMKFTKDFVKSLDVDTFVSPDIKLEEEGGSFQFFNAAKQFGRKQSVKESLSDDEEEECDVVRVTPPPSEDELPVTSGHEVTGSAPESVVRPNVIRWYSPPSRTDATNAPHLPGGEMVPYYREMEFPVERRPGQSCCYEQPVFASRNVEHKQPVFARRNVEHERRVCASRNVEHEQRVCARENVEHEQHKRTSVQVEQNKLTPSSELGSTMYLKNK